MNFPHIVALLDEELERLQRARTILSTLHPIQLPKQERAPRSAKPASAAVSPDKGAPVVQAEAPAEPAPAPEPGIVRADKQVRRARRSRPAAPKSTEPKPSGPLGPSAHSRPVFVRAELLTPRSTSASAKSAGSRHGVGVSPVLSAEALAKRWLSTPSA